VLALHLAQTVLTARMPARLSRLSIVLTLHARARLMKLIPTARLTARHSLLIRPTAATSLAAI
jgi:hypothetical protein